MIKELEKYQRDRYKSDYFLIENKEWELIKGKYEQDVVKESLAELAATWPLPYATDKYEWSDVVKDYGKLKGIRWNEMLKEGEWFMRQATETKYPLTFDGTPLYFKRYNVGNLSSNKHQEANRWSICSSGYPGPKRTWETPAFMKSLMGAAYSLKLDQIGKKELRLMISLRKYIASQHKPNITKSITEYFGSKTMLDFSMGWGDRLSGALSLIHI